MAAIGVSRLPSERSKTDELSDVSHLKKILVLGGTGTLGRATIRSLVKSGFSVVACTRDPNSEKSKAISGPEVQLCATDCVNKAGNGCDAAVVIPPGFEARGQWTVDMIDTINKLGLSRLIVISVPGARPDAEFQFGREFGEMEKGLRDKGVTPVILRLPMFMENLYGSLCSIKRDNTLQWRPKEDALYSPVSVVDVGDAVAAILSNFDAHAGKEYALAAPAISGRDVAETVGLALGKRVNVEQVDDGTFLEEMQKLGIPRWQANGVLELMHLVDGGHLNLRSKDLQALLGREPTTLEQFVNGDFKRALLA